MPWRRHCPLAPRRKSCACPVATGALTHPHAGPFAPSPFTNSNRGPRPRADGIEPREPPARHLVRRERNLAPPRARPGPSRVLLLDGPRPLDIGHQLRLFASSTSCCEGEWPPGVVHDCNSRAWAERMALLFEGRVIERARLRRSSRGKVGASMPSANDHRPTIAACPPPLSSSLRRTLEADADAPREPVACRARMSLCSTPIETSDQAARLVGRQRAVWLDPEGDPQLAEGGLHRAPTAARPNPQAMGLSRRERSAPVPVYWSKTPRPHRGVLVAQPDRLADRRAASPIRRSRGSTPARPGPEGKAAGRRRRRLQGSTPKRFVGRRGSARRWSEPVGPVITVSPRSRGYSISTAVETILAAAPGISDLNPRCRPRSSSGWPSAAVSTQESSGWLPYQTEARAAPHRGPARSRGQACAPAPPPLLQPAAGPVPGHVSRERGSFSIVLR